MTYQIELDEVSQVLSQHLMESKSLEHIKYLKRHYERNYYVAKARGKRVLRLQISKLNRLVSVFQVKEATTNYQEQWSN